MCIRRSRLATIGSCLLLCSYLATPGARAAEPVTDSPSSAADAVHAAYARGDFRSAQALLQQAPPAVRDTPRMLFAQALLDDAAGRHAEAQQRYEALRGTPLASSVAIPAAINLVAQAKLREASNAFAKAAETARSPALLAYLQQWQLYLLARSQGGPASALQTVLRERGASLRPANPVQRALVALYRGEGSADAVLDAVASMDVDAQARRDTLTESVFFAGSYLLYVRGDRPTAALLFRQEMALPPSASSERMLIRQMLASF